MVYPLIDDGAGSVLGNLESQHRRYALVEAAKAGLMSVSVIDDDLGKTGSGAVILLNRPIIMRKAGRFAGLSAAICRHHHPKGTLLPKRTMDAAGSLTQNPELENNIGPHAP
jgi:hypothetical protein